MTDILKCIICFVCSIQVDTLQSAIEYIKALEQLVSQKRISKQTSSSTTAAAAASSTSSSFVPVSSISGSQVYEQGILPPPAYSPDYGSPCTIPTNQITSDDGVYPDIYNPMTSSNDIRSRESSLESLVYSDIPPYQGVSNDVISHDVIYQDVTSSPNSSHSLQSPSSFQHMPELHQTTQHSPATMMSSPVMTSSAPKNDVPWDLDFIDPTIHVSMCNNDIIDTFTDTFSNHTFSAVTQQSVHPPSSCNSFV